MMTGARQGGYAGALVQQISMAKTTGAAATPAPVVCPVSGPRSTNGWRCRRPRVPHMGDSRAFWFGALPALCEYHQNSTKQREKADRARPAVSKADPWVAFATWLSC
jgi:hypothetical protein